MKKVFLIALSVLWIFTFSVPSIIADTINTDGSQTVASASNAPDTGASGAAAVAGDAGSEEGLSMYTVVGLTAAAIAAAGLALAGGSGGGGDSEQGHGHGH